MYAKAFSIFKGKKRLELLVGLLIVLISGLVVFVVVQAASSTAASTEAESGTLAGVTKIGDASTSGGYAVQFGSGTSKPVQLSQPFFNYAYRDNNLTNAYQTETDPTDKNLLWQILATPMAVWLGVNTNEQQFTSWIQGMVNSAAASNTTPIFVLYAIPDRDCGGYSAGGFPDKQSYENWVDWFTTGLGNSPAIVIVEPDAIALCGTQQEKDDRIAMLKYVLDNIQVRDPNAYAYIHAGSGSVPISSAVSILTQIDISHVRGFALNVSSFGTNSEEETYGDQLVAALDQAGVPDMHYVIDTSRNGLGRDTSGNGGAPEWCNPPGRAVGLRPTTQTGNPLVDAYLWIKDPETSDGVCHTGDPPAGSFFLSYALEHVQNGLDNNTIVALPNGTYYTSN